MCFGKCIVCIILNVDKDKLPPHSLAGELLYINFVVCRKFPNYNYQTNNSLINTSPTSNLLISIIINFH